ncbi:MAG: tripartite tricarboxylate transporter TctB family protein [Pseudomonadota bacterium]
MLNRDRVGALIMLVFSVAYGALAFEIPLLPFQRNAAFTAQTLPLALAVLGIGLSFALLLKPSDGGTDTTGFKWGLGALICVFMVIYGLTVRPFGFILATSLFLIACMLSLGERRWLLILGSSIPLVVAFWFLMAVVLDVYVAPWPNL